MRKPRELDDTQHAPQILKFKCTIHFKRLFHWPFRTNNRMDTLLVHVCMYVHELSVLQINPLFTTKPKIFTVFSYKPQMAVRLL